MSMFSRPRVLQRSQSTCQSSNSHSSESGVSHPSDTSSNTSWATHFPQSSSNAHTSLPKGAGPPQLNPPMTYENDAINSSETSPRKPRVLRKQPPPVSYPAGPQSRNSTKRWLSFRTSPRAMSATSLPRVRVNLDDDAPATVTDAPGPSRHLSLPVPLKSSTLPVSSYRVPQRSHTLQRTRSRSPPRTRSINGRVVYPSEPGPRRSEVLNQLCAELMCVGEDGRLSPSTEGNIYNRSSIASPAPARRDKPLPTPPEIADAPPKQSSAVQSISPSMDRTYPSNSLRRLSHVGASAEEEAESQFGHFNPSSNSSVLDHGYEYAYTQPASWSDVGHSMYGHVPVPGPSWSDSGHGSGYATPPWDDAHPNAVYQASEPHYSHRNHRLTFAHPAPYPVQSLPSSSPGRSASTSFTTLPPRLPSSVRPLSTLASSTRSVPRLPSSVRPSSTLASSTRSAPLFSSRGSYLEEQVSAPRLSLGKRIKRSLSLSLSVPSTEVGQQRRESSYSYSDTGHGSTFGGSASTSSHHLPRKLKKRAPSLLNPRAAMPPSTYGLESRSATALHVYTELSPQSNTSPRMRRKSSPIQRTSQEMPPLVPPLPKAFQPTSTIFTPESVSPPSSPTRSRKLTKQAPRKKGSASETLDMTLPPVRAVSPLGVDLRMSSFANPSRSQSTPNLWPPGPGAASSSRIGFEDARPRFFLADSPSESPNASQVPLRDAPQESQAPLLPARPSFLRSQSNRRWTLAVSEVPDEQLVEELERLRSVGWGLGFQGELIMIKGKGKAAGDGTEEYDMMWNAEEDEGWRVARRALMVCREIVRTERNYRQGMLKLQHGETQKAPPPLLLRYLPALISASQAFNARLDEDPSAWGVSAAFLSMEEELEVALVAWSGVVGEFFTTNKGKRRRQWTISMGDKEKKEKEREHKSVVGTMDRPAVGSSEDGHGHGQPAYVGAKSAPSSWRRSMPALPQLLSSTSETSPSDGRRPWYSSGSHASLASIKTPSVQDLAIQPTQRVMRYVLLYKDLLHSTPRASPARALVERALDGATRIAQRCNRTQDNAAFLV